MKRTFAEETREFSDNAHQIGRIIAEETGLRWLVERIAGAMNRVVIWWENRQR